MSHASASAGSHRYSLHLFLEIQVSSRVPFLSKTFRHPVAGAGAARAWAPPHAAAVTLGQMPVAIGRLAAGLHGDPHGALRGDPTLHRDHAALVDDRSVGDLHAKAIRRAAGSAVGRDDNAPIAIVSGAGI